MNTIALQKPSSARLSIGAAIVVASWVIGFASLGGNLLSLVHVSSAVIVAAGPIMLMRVSRLNKSWQNTERSGQMLTLGNAAVASGVIGTVIGLVHVMENLDKPDQIGVGIAVAVLAMLYGLVTHFLLMPFMIEKAGLQEKMTPKTDLAFYGVLSFTLLMLVTFIVLYALNMTH